MSNKTLEESKFSQQNLIECCEFWLSKCSSGHYPRPADIDPLDYPVLLGNILIIELAAPIEDIFYRLYGRATTNYYGIDLTGWAMRDIPERIF